MSDSKIENTVHLVFEIQLDMILCVSGRHCCSLAQSVPFPHVSTGLIPSAGNIGCPCLGWSCNPLTQVRLRNI